MRSSDAADRRLALAELVKASRPFSWINTAYVFVAGAAVGSGWSPGVLAGAIYFLLPYNLLLYGINDIFDYPSDLRNPRKNSLEGAIVRPSRFRAVYLAIAVTNVPLLVVLFATANGKAAATLGLLLVTTIAYSVPPLRWKEVPLLDALTSASHFVLPLLFGLFYARAHRFPWLETAAFVLWAMASQAFGAIQDVTPDREAGISSIATALGGGSAAVFSLGLYTAAVALVITAHRSPTYLGMAVVLALYPLHVLLYFRDPTEANAHRHWRVFLFLNLLTGLAVTRAFYVHGNLLTH